MKAKTRFLPEYSGKQIVRGEWWILSSNRSFLFRKRMMEVSTNHLLLQMESKSFMLSIILGDKKFMPCIREINQR